MTRLHPHPGCISARLFRFSFIGLLLLCVLTAHPQYITPFAGGGSCCFGGDGGPAIDARLFSPRGLAVDKQGNVYIGDGARIRKVTVSTNIITTIAGTTIPPNESGGFSGDGGPATQALIGGAYNIAFDTAGNLFFADRDNGRIRKIDLNGTITTVAGNGYSGLAGDGGPATDARLYWPAGVAVDSAGNLFISDTYNNAIRKVNTSGIISTLAGNGTAGFAGDNGSATAALVNKPYGIALDRQGNIYFADQDNHRVRKIDLNGIITTFAGTGTGGYTGDNGPATQARIYYPSSLAFDTSGNLFIADYQNNRIRKVNAAGLISTVAGNGFFGSDGNWGLATSATIGSVSGIAVNRQGIIYLAAGSYQVRKVGPFDYTIMCDGANTSMTSNINGAISYVWQRNTGSGYVSLTNNANFSGVFTRTLQLTNMASSATGHKFRCLSNSNTYSREFILKFSNSWTGAISTNWENPGNWSCGKVPDNFTDVIIDSGAVVVNASTTVRTLTVSPGASLTVDNGVTLTVLQ